MDGENSSVDVVSVLMIVVCFFLLELVADVLYDDERALLRSRERLRSEGLSLRLRGSSSGMWRLTDVLVLDLDRISNFVEDVMLFGVWLLVSVDIDERGIFQPQAVVVLVLCC